MKEQPKQAPFICSGCFSFAEILTRKYKLPYFEQLQELFSSYGFERVKMLFETIESEMNKSPHTPSLRTISRIFEKDRELRMRTSSLRAANKMYNVFRKLPEESKIKECGYVNYKDFLSQELNKKELKISQDMGGAIDCQKLAKESKDSFLKVFSERHYETQRRPQRKSTPHFTMEEDTGGETINRKGETP